MGFAYKIVGLDEEPVVYRGDNVVDTFIARMMEGEEFLKDKLKTENALPLEMTEEDEMAFKQASVKECVLMTMLKPPLIFKIEVHHLRHSIIATEQHISHKDYDYACQVWDTLGIQSLGEYHDLYCLTDVLLLADVFGNFREVCYRHYGLDPANFYTSPGLAWQACLEMSRQRLELLTDLDMHLFIEKGLRGGISMISNRYSEANNPYLSTYDQTSPSKYIMYLQPLWMGYVTVITNTW